MEHFSTARPDRSSPQKTGSFTGEVWGESRLAGGDGPMVNAVLFSPGARTHWHRHEDGQILHVTAGQGYVGTRDGFVTVSAGDVVWAPGGEEHYHGATPESFLLHDAISLGSIDWLDEVTDDEYGDGAST